MKRNLPTSASFLLSEDCNLACTYCFELNCRNSNKMTKEVAEQGLQFLSNNALLNGEKTFDVMFFGGEPLLNVEVLEYVFKRGLEIADEKNLFFNASIVTNATIYTKKIEKIFKEYGKKTNFHIQLSVDGVKEVHDKYRVTKAGKGSFDIIEKNIPKFLALRDFDIGVTIHGCSNKETLPRLFENYLFFREQWGFEHIWFMPIHSEEWETSDVPIYAEQLNKIANYILEKAKETGDTREVQFYAPIDKCLSNYGRASSPCGAGKNFVTVVANGDVYPCHQFYFNDPDKHTAIGSVYKGINEDKREIYTNYDSSDLSCLKDNPNCEATGCYICIADNYNINGSVLSTVAGPRCAMSKVEKNVQDRVKKELEKMGLLKKDKEHNQADLDSGDVCKCNSRNFEPNHSDEAACANPHTGCNCGEDKEFQKDLLTHMASSIVDMGEMLEKVLKQNKKLKSDIKKIKREIKFVGRKI